MQRAAGCAAEVSGLAQRPPMQDRPRDPFPGSAPLARFGVVPSPCSRGREGMAVEHKLYCILTLQPAGAARSAPGTKDQGAVNKATLWHKELM